MCVCVCVYSNVTGVDVNKALSDQVLSALRLPESLVNVVRVASDGGQLVMDVSGSCPVKKVICVCILTKKRRRKAKEKKIVMDVLGEDDDLTFLS